MRKIWNYNEELTGMIEKITKIVMDWKIKNKEGGAEGTLRSLIFSSINARVVGLTPREHRYC